MMKKWLLPLILNFALCIFNSSFCFPKNKNTDSLQALLKTDKADTNKVNHLNRLSWEFIGLGEYDSAIKNCNQALALSNSLIIENKRGWEKGAAKAYNNIGLVYKNQGNYFDALEKLLLALKINKKINYKKGIVASLTNIGIIYAEQGDYSKALEYFFRVMEIQEVLGDKSGIASGYSNIGNIYNDQSEYSKALNYYLKALEISKSIENKQMVANVLGNIGNVYKKQADLIRERGDTVLSNEKYIKALECYSQSLKIKEEFGNKHVVAIALINMGSINSDIGYYLKAMDFYHKALKITEEIGDKQGIARCLGNIGPLYVKIGKLEEAEQYLKRAISMEEEKSWFAELMNDENSLSQLYNTTGRYKEALIHYRKSIILKDTIFSQENKKQLVRKEMNYEFDKREAATKAENEKQQAVAEEKNRKQKFITLSVAGGLLLVIVFAGFVFRSLRITRKQKQIIENKNSETEHQKKIIEEKNKDITDSIRYAKQIQDALMGEKDHVSMHLPEHFILFIPKDIVSGDFHWGVEKQGYWYFAAVDCTGHGVPGAIMSMLGISFLNDIVSSEQILSPAEILNRLRDKVVKELRQTGEAGGSKDGMDISLARLNLKNCELQWAGANNSLNLIRNGKMEEMKADKQPIGYHPEMKRFTNHEIQLQKGDSIYIYSDGYADQFGGSNRKKFKYKQLEDLLIANNHLPLKEQKQILKGHFNEWKGLLEQVDDVCIFGVRI